MKEITLLVGHGSRDSDGNEEFLDFMHNLRQQMPDQHVEGCFLELATPTIPEGIAECIRQGADRIVVVPVILLAASHVKLEIPEFLDAARTKYPHVEIVYGRNIGLHEQIINLLSERFQEQAVVLSNEDIRDTAIVLMGRGSSDPDANGDLYKIARQLWERTGVLTVEVCFTGITFPRLPEGVRRAVSLGSKRVIVVPYFLFTGVLMKRMKDVLQELQDVYPTISLSMAEYFGMHRRLFEIVRDRQEEAAHNEAFMNCDLCKYRKLAVHEHSHEHARHPDHLHDRPHAHTHEPSPSAHDDAPARREQLGLRG